MLRSAFVWAGVAFVTSGFTAYRLDSAPNFDRPKMYRIALRSVGALFQGTATTISVYLAFMHTFGQGELNVLLLPDPLQSKLSIYCLISFLLGASLYTTSGFGRLRQRRNSGRRRVKRSIRIHSGQEETAGNTVNVSREVALIESYEYLPTEKPNIEISADTGASSLGRIVKVRGNYIHIHFLEESNWHALQNELEIPVAV